MLKFLAILFLAISTLAAQASTQEFIRHYTYIAGEADSKLTARQMALQEVKRELLSEIGTHIYSRIDISTDSSGKSDAKQEIRALTAGFVKVDVIEEKWDGYQFFIKAMLKADPDEIVQRIKNLNKKDEKSEQLKKDLIQSNNESNKLRLQMASLREQLKQTKSFDQKQLVSEKYIKKSQALTAIDLYNQAGDYYYGRNDQYMNREKAFPLYLQAANQGHMMAQYSLGLMYQKGNGVPKNQQQAFYWFKKASQQDYVWAQNILGEMYLKGEGTTKDLNKAVYWIKKSAEKNHLWSQYNLAKMYLKGEGVNKDAQQAVYWYRQAAKQGDAWSQLALANHYKSGNGTTQDYEQALYWYQKSADQSNHFSQFSLAELYFKGHGTTKNHKIARRYFTLSAEQGNKWAQYALANMYRHGQGGVRNMKSAKHWYKMAAQQGLAKAISQLKSL